MQIYNWKKTSDFIALLDFLQDEGEEGIVSINKKVSVGWFHTAILSAMYPSKKVIFITKDDRVKKILKQSGYKVFSAINEIHKFLPEGFQIMQENLSIFEYTKFHILRFFYRFYGYTKNLKPNREIFAVKHSSWYVLVLGIIIVLLLMIGIVTLTNPHASIIITPQTSIQNAIKNVVFSLPDELGLPGQIPLKKDVFSFDIKKTYHINTLDPTSLQRAKGTVRIINIGSETYRLRPQTRLISNSLVFRTENWIEIPPAVDSKPGIVFATIVADAVGGDGVLMGERGNISQDSPLLFPGLSDKDHRDITILAHDNFKGGSNISKPLLTQDEYDRIEKIFREQILVEAQNYKTKKYNKNDEFIPLPMVEALSPLDMPTAADLSVGAQSDKITFSSKAHFMIYLYNQAILRKILIETARNHMLDNTESLVEISDSPPDIIATLSKIDEPFSIKATAQIPVQVLYDFTSPTGRKTLQNMLSDLLDADAERAKKTLLNHPYVKAIDIRLTPFWSKKIPATLDKIDIKIKESDS